MKKIFTLIAAVGVGHMLTAQTVFQSDLSSWNGSGDPTDWMGNTTNIASADVVENQSIVSYGTSVASLINTTATHARFTTQPVAVTPGETYEITMWVGASQGDLRTNFYDVTNAAYGTYNSYIDLAVASGGNLTMLSQTVTIPAGCTDAEFILSLRNTDPATAGVPFFIGIILDSVDISVGTPPTPSVQTIFDIQNAAGDSPYKDSTVSTGGIVTAVNSNGYSIQAGTGAFKGIWVEDATNAASATRGDSVLVTGLVDEFFNFTRLKNVTAFSVESSGNTEPAATMVTTMGANAEDWEGTKIMVQAATCSLDNDGFGQWIISDGSGNLLVDDEIYDYPTPTINNIYNVTGIGWYSFSEFKLQARDINDVEDATGIKEEAIAFSLYPNPVQDVLNIQASSNIHSVNIIDAGGKLVETVKPALGLNQLEVGTARLAAGTYTIQIVTENGVGAQTLIK